MPWLFVLFVLLSVHYDDKAQTDRQLKCNQQQFYFQICYRLLKLKRSLLHDSSDSNESLYQNRNRFHFISISQSLNLESVYQKECNKIKLFLNPFADNLMNFPVITRIYFCSLISCLQMYHPLIWVDRCIEHEHWYINTFYLLHYYCIA